MKAPLVLALGYGNPGRGDDGLGPAAAERLGALRWPGVTVGDPYQLAPEDAVDVAAHDLVWFIDAARAGPEPFFAQRVTPAETIDFDSHRMSPQTLLALAERYCGKAPEAWLMGVRGYEFEFREGLSAKAAHNLDCAFALLRRRIGDYLGALE